MPPLPISWSQTSPVAPSLQFRRGLKVTFFDAATPAAIKRRMQDGSDADLKAVLKVGAVVVAAVACLCLGSPTADARHCLGSHLHACCMPATASMQQSAPPPPLPAQSYKPLMPPRSDQVFFQGGTLVFEGPRLLFSHYDPATSAHADFQQVVAAATQGR